MTVTAAAAASISTHNRSNDHRGHVRSSQAVSPHLEAFQRLTPHSSQVCDFGSGVLLSTNPITYSSPIPASTPLPPDIPITSYTPRRTSDPPITKFTPRHSNRRYSTLSKISGSPYTPSSSSQSTPIGTPRQNLNYPLPLTPSQSLAAIAIMQERQESWTRAAQSSSSASAASSPGSSTSPVNRLTSVTSGTTGTTGGSRGASGGGVQRRTSLNTESMGEGRSGSTSGRGSKPRKKVAKACLACQKSHLTCDELRPCTRCTKKGIAEQCVEGVRKKAKYLLEGEERGRTDVTTNSTQTQSNHSQPPPITHNTQQPMSITPVQTFESLPSNPTAMSQLPDLLPDQPNQPRVPGDVWLSGPLGGLENDQMGVDARQIWNDPRGSISSMNGNEGVIKQGGQAGDTMFSLGPTAAADEFHMFDSMFGNMSPVFPFNTTSSSGQNDTDPFGLNALNGNNQNTGGNGDGFGSTWTTNDFTQNQTVSNGMNAFGGGGMTNTNNSNNGFDLNAAWTTWTTGNANNNGNNNNNNNNNNNVTSTNNNNMNNSNTNNLNGQSNHPSDHSTGISPLSGMSVPLNPPSRSNSAPAGPAALNQSPSVNTHMPNPPRTQSNAALQPVNQPPSQGLNVQNNGSAGQGLVRTLSGNIENEIQPIGTGPFAMIHPGAGTNGNGFRGSRATPSEVYRTVVKPYDYTEGYHILMQYLTTNFEQRDVLRVVHSLAAYRPSLIALQMPMSEEDEVFIERSFQRTLIELEKLISYSATPTAVWRRTGEVCYANPEFCRLVGRNETELCATKSYIYHIFDKTSVIAYWENFSNHAFENTTQNFFQSTLLQQAGKEASLKDPVRCSACYTIRRDVFDLPSVIIGQFLPIPNDIL